MNYRMLSATVFALVLAVEIFMFTSTPIPYKDVFKGISSEPGFSKYIGMTKETTLDYELQQETNQKYAIIIGATVILGAMVTFSIPNKK